MTENRGIKIYNFSIAEDRKYLERLFDSLMQIEDLVPVIGSGFTSGLRTQNGMIPSVAELRREMAAIMHTIDGSTEDEFADISLADFSDVFWEELEKRENRKHKARFQDYIESNFTKVYDVEQSKRHLLNSNWKTIFTLNYDDTIESVLDIDVIIPYDKFNNHSRKGNLIKLHGDAKKFSITGDSKFCVLGNQQYVNLIKNESNVDIVKALENTFFSKSVLFIGCSLVDELDLLYSAGIQLGQKAKMNQEHHVIYLYYSNEDVDVNPFPYKKYGITDIIKVNGESIDELYEFIYAINKNLGVLRQKDLLQEYTNIEFQYLDARNRDNINYLFYNDKVKINNGIIRFPAFFVERSCIKRLQEEILLENSVLKIIYGAKFSGKTYALLQLLKNLLHKKVYYFPSYISLSDDLVEYLCEKKETILLIDDGAISFEQYRNIIIPKVSQLQESKIRIVMTVSKGDVDFYKYYKNMKGAKEASLQLFELDNKFDKDEMTVFNEKIGNISLVPYGKNNTILDYLFRVEDNLLEKNTHTILPEVNFLSNDCEKEVRALIILATKGFVTSKMAIELEIDDILYGFTKKFSVTVQKDYLSDIEKEGDNYSGFKFVLNSSYWAIKCLSNFAINSCNHKTIVKAYCNIVCSYGYLDRNTMNNRIKAYYMLDRIQYLFSDRKKRGTIRLPYMIYEGLHSSLNWNYQFLHQEAKCELRMARRENASERKKNMLEQAFKNIGRAMELAEESTSGNIEYTIAHMNVTKALILINYVLMGEQTELKRTVETCYEAFVVGESLCPQLEKEEMKDVKVFLNRGWSEDVEESVKDKFGELYTRYINKPSWINYQ